MISVLDAESPLQKYKGDLATKKSNKIKMKMTTVCFTYLSTLKSDFYN